MVTRIATIVDGSDLFDQYRNDPAVLALKERNRERAALQARRDRRIERRPCACRGYVEADPLDPTEGVRAHQASPEHGAWREARDL